MAPTTDQMTAFVNEVVSQYFHSTQAEWKHSTVVSGSVCKSVCPQAYLWNHMSDIYQNFCAFFYGHDSVLFLQRGDTLCNSGYVDDVVLK